LIREWGRVGSPGTVRKDWFETEELADSARSTITQKKIKKGYHFLNKNIIQQQLLAE